MFGILESLAKAAVSVVEIPVAIAADVVTMGGAMTDQEKPYTAQAVSNLVQNIQDASNPNRK